MDINKFEIIKELGHGMIGTVFLAKYKDKEYALKIEHILEKDIEKSKSSSVWREISFCEKFSNKYPDQFIKLYSYDIIDKCSHKQKYSLNIKLLNKNVQNKIKDISKSNYCIRKVYSLIDGSLNNILNNLSKNQIYSLILQYSYTILLMHNNNYIHDDIHNGNIGYLKTNKKYIKILDNKIPTFGYIFKIIDYGFVMNKNNSSTNNNKNFFEDRKFYESNFGNIDFILNILYSNNDFFNHLKDNNIEYNYDLLFNQFLKSDEYKMLSYLSRNDYNCFFIYILIFPEKYQRLVLKDKFEKVIEYKIRTELFDILYLMKYYSNISDINDIINYYKSKLNI